MASQNDDSYTRMATLAYLFINFLSFSILTVFACSEYIAQTMQGNEMEFEILIAGNDHYPTQVVSVLMTSH